MEDKENKYLRARERVEGVKKFYSNLFSFFLTIIFLAAVNYYTNQWHNPWFLWVVFGWGIGIFFMAAKTFGYPVIFGKDWEKRKLEQFMSEDEERQQWK
ncbi:MAG: 2TM domain-containing protein [Sediminicola sp.]|tara:strand:+ start:54548 stop:54844 length:297 start_codon:yes stop_codon:yes gene_type:complete